MSDEINIVVHGFPVGLEDWSRAKRAALSEVPALNDAQSEVVRKLGLSEEDYARSILAQRYGSERIRHRAKKFGLRLAHTLHTQHISGQIVKLERWPGEQVWIADILTQSGAGRVQIPIGLFDDAVDDKGDDANYTKWLDVKLSSLVQKSLKLGDVA